MGEETITEQYALKALIEDPDLFEQLVGEYALETFVGLMPQRALEKRVF